MRSRAINRLPLVGVQKELTVRVYRMLISQCSMFTDQRLGINFPVRITGNVFSDVFALICLAKKNKKKKKYTAAVVMRLRPVWASLGCVLQPMNKITWCRNSRGPDWRLHSLGGEGRWNNSPGLPFSERIPCHCAEMTSSCSWLWNVEKPTLLSALHCLSQCFLRWFSTHLERTFVRVPTNLWLIKYDSPREKCISADLMLGLFRCVQMWNVWSWIISLDLSGWWMSSH